MHYNHQKIKADRDIAIERNEARWNSYFRPKTEPRRIALRERQISRDAAESVIDDIIGMLGSSNAAIRSKGHPA